MRSSLLIIGLACSVVATTPRAGAATLEGQEFEDGIRLAQHELRLNGLGVRKIFFIKAYVAGLYLNEKAATPAALVALPGPKRLQLRMLRGAGPDDFNSALVAGIRKNAGEAELLRLADRVSQLELTIKSIGLTVKGDVINLDYLPGLGTQLTINGTRQGQAIFGADFFTAILGIFVGDQPVDALLKKGLLGQ
ncbi:MAG: chalcone isomerase family protein [Rhodoferax sp.]|uniref:chalcone isomerase family protein n=1 Tax=Rhodoferax sp. TaxID=50421 RepID=UPI00261C03F9|nr:chalcone isomerase family protein [Rhodoferax sp.]MDD5336057.1 chalcone isomerase family protein [Rhodoferax sp.]